VHPKCEFCNKALHRSPKAGVRVRSGPQIYCRNKDCEKNKNVEQNEPTVEKKKLKRKAIPKEDETQDQKKNDLEKTDTLRDKIRGMLNITSVEVQSHLLTLVIVAQEIGENELADALIKRFKLEKYFIKQIIG
jgi:hypothetical protein